jgi:hypothetical protein
MNSPTLFDRWRQVDEAATAAETAVFEATVGMSRGGAGPTQAQWELARKLRGQASALYQLASFVQGDEPLRHIGSTGHEPSRRGGGHRHA